LFWRLKTGWSQIIAIFADKKLMKSQNSIYVIFCLSLAVVLLGVFNIFTAHFNGHESYERQISLLKKDMAQADFERTLATHQLKDFQITVAQALPENSKIQADFRLKNLASVVRSPASVQPLDLSAVIYERARKSFADEKYDKAIKEFNRLLDEYPLSSHVVESRFFVAESYFLKKDYKNSLLQIDEMVTQYPDSDLTGFILLRMGQISEANNQVEEASEVYRTVIKNFKNENLVSQAKKLSQGVEFK
jgi:TolA-binding protein